MTEPFVVRISHSEAKQWQALGLRNVIYYKQTDADKLAAVINRPVAVLDPGGNLVYTAKPNKG